MADQLRQIGDLEDAKTAFVLHLDNVKAHFEITPPTQCFLKFFWDEASKEETSFHTDTIKDCAQHQAFVFAKDWNYVTKAPKTLGSHTFMIQIHGTVDKKKKVLGEARIDFGTLATGPRSYTLHVLTAELTPVGTVDFDFKMHEVSAKVELHAIIEAKTSLQTGADANRDGVCPTLEIFNKRYSPQQQERDQLKPIESAKFKMPKREKGDNSAATTKYPFDSLIVSDQTIESLEDLWVRISFEPVTEKSKNHPMAGGESVFPLKYILSLDPTKPKTFTALVKKMAVNLVRYEVGSVEGRLRIENGPKFAQLADGKYNGIKVIVNFPHPQNLKPFPSSLAYPFALTGLQGGHRIPGTVATTIKKIPTNVDEVEHPATPIQDNNSPLIGDLQLDSIKPQKPKEGPQKYEAPSDLPPVKKSESVKANPVQSPAPLSPSNPQTPNRTQQSSQTPPRVQITPTMTSSTPQSYQRVQVTTVTSSTPKAQVTPKTSTPKKVEDDDDLLSVVCGMCGDLVPESDVVLTHKNKNFCKKCAKILVEKKKEMERAKAELQQSPSPKATPSKSAMSVPKAQSDFRSRASSASADSITAKPTSPKSRESPTSSKKTTVSPGRTPVNQKAPVNTSNDYVDNLLAQLEGDVEKVEAPKKSTHKQAAESSKTSASSSSPSMKSKAPASPSARSKEDPSKSPLAVTKTSETSKRHSSYAPGGSASPSNRKAPRIADGDEDPTKGIQPRPMPKSSKSPAHTPAPAPVPVQPTVIHVAVPVPVPMYNGMMMGPGMVPLSMMGVPMQYNPQPMELVQQPAPITVKEQPAPQPVQAKPKKAEPARTESPKSDPKVTLIPATDFVYNNKPEVRSKVIKDEPKVTGIQIVSTDNAAGGNVSSDMVVKDMVISLPAHQAKNASLLVDAVELMEDK